MNEELRAMNDRLDRIEGLLTVLVDALAGEEDDGDQPEQTLDGQPLAGERDPWSPL